jgi:HD superfamily phosphohydrolase
MPSDRLPATGANFGAMAARRKILNDPIYGFITVPHPVVLRLIDHPWFQRLRHIKQLGLSHLVYPGALHTRFHHALGAMHLMGLAIDVLRSKGHAIDEEEALGAHIAILLHDIGHGPFSHTLEHALVEGISHEALGALVMDALDREMDGALRTGIRIFRDEHPKARPAPAGEQPARHGPARLPQPRQLLHRRERGRHRRRSHHQDAGSGERPAAGREKGIYSIEKFIVARRLMYWQVYLHKTVVSAEGMLQQALQRAKDLAAKGQELFCSPPLRRFLYKPHDAASFSDTAALADFMRLDDHDIMGAIKVWASHSDKVLATLCADLVERRTFRIRLSEAPWPADRTMRIKAEVARQLGVPEKDADHFVLTGRIVNNAYDTGSDAIELLYKDGTVKDIAEASDNLGIRALARPVEKFYLAWPRWVDPVFEPGPGSEKNWIARSISALMGARSTIIEMPAVSRRHRLCLLTPSPMNTTPGRRSSSSACFARAGCHPRLVLSHHGRGGGFCREQASAKWPVARAAIWLLQGRRS